jgi:hypothetical protein
MRYTIKVEATLNGKTCKNPQIEFVQGEEFLFPCKIEGDQITLELRPGYNPNACIEGFIKCDDECLNCPPQHFKVCLCNDVTLLEACQVCKDGFIEDLCTAEDLLLGKICTPNGCQCPPEKPVEDPNTGQCVQCITGTTQGCKVCVGGSWEDITCGENERCFDGGCDCTEGYVRGPFTKLCVPKSECDDDSQCDECEYCSPTGCQPIVCPEGYKCYKGDCVYWPCTSTSCENGADCGPDCGCVVFEGIKQCVPCHILECEGLCELALGCKCNGVKCEGVGDCNEYCDGNTPCTDPNCTCYNNRCVKCSNFPCPGDCSNHYNCGCSDTNNCEGGRGCNDNLELKKIENCPTECALEATYTTESGCNCDPIEFRIKNVKNCSLTETRPTSTILNLNTEMFKNGKAYKNYLNEITIGDDEEVQATLRTTIVFYKKNAQGKWVLDSTPANATSVLEVSAAGNVFDNIIITTDNIGFPGVTSTIITNRKVEIQVKAVGVKIPANDCIKYTEKVIGKYELDFSNNAYCAKVNTYKEEQKATLNDNTSVRRPLFVWSKSTTSTYLSSKFPTTGVYKTSGWFRKEYGEKSGNTWKDKINKTTEGLLNNYNYKVTVDCGCKSNVATLEKVVFCCPKDWSDLYSITNCGRTITVKAFDTCAVNKKLGSGFPQEVQTYYYVTINGEEKVLRADGGNLLNEYSYQHPDPITSVVFDQRYTGSPIIAKACEVSYDETPDVPDFDITTTCGQIVVKKRAGTPVITGVTFVGFTGTFTASTNKETWTATVPKVSAVYRVSTSFQGNCIFAKDAQVICKPEVEAIETDIYAKAECPNGVNPDITVEVKAGFTAAAEFQDPRNGTWYPASASNPTRKTFTNFAAGTYTFNVRETGKENATDTVTILPMITPTVTTTDICGINAGSITLAGGAPNSQWRITGPAPFSQQTIQLGSAGSGTLQIPYTSSTGKYFATLVTDPTGATCQQTLDIDITKGGGTVTPQIIYSQSSVCQGGEIAFRVVDGMTPGITYNVSSYANSLVITDLDDNIVSTVTSTTTGQFTHKIRPTLAGNYGLTLSLPQGTCYTLGAMPPNNIESRLAPVITAFSAVCTGVIPFQYNVSVTTSSSENTSVNVAGVALTNSVGNTWIGTNLNLSQTTAIATATNSVTGCTDTMTIVLEQCTGGPEACPPPQPVTITTSPVSPTCGAENVSVLFNSTGLGSIEGLEYQWVEEIGGAPFALMSGTIDSGTMLPNVNGVPNLEVFSGNQPKYYRLSIIENGICANNSDLIEVVAGTNIEPMINGSTTVMTGQAYTYFTQDIPGATYTWTLSNTNGSNQPVGTNSASVTISTFAPGNNTINVTVTNGACSGSGMLVVSGNLDCPQTVSIFPVVGIGYESCRDMTFSINNGTSITSHRWLVDGVSYQSGGGSILNLDLSDLPAGSTPDIVLEVIFGNCLKLSNTYAYERCSCICGVNNSCNTNQIYNGVGGQGLIATTPSFPAGKQLRLNVTVGTNNLAATDRFTVNVVNGGTTNILDTGYPYRVYEAATCPETNYPLDIVDLSAAALNDDVSGSLVYALNPVIITNLGEISLRMDYTTAAGDVIEVYHNDTLCSSQGAWSFTVTCL